MQGVEDTRLKRRVVVVGIAGASGSGKSSLANHLADFFESPVIPISGDWFFDKKKMPKGLDGHLNWETPEGIDWESFSENLTRVKKQLETEETVPYSINIERPGFFFFSLFPNI
eukprot:TRINITY_DN1218_c0_g2_i19.p3 TRINITY_DN1218_c0_g2~~TRINITY_DN1218_c0_g2_i19.p3  ORF type:complete len:114 (+),score=14.51 TRINITY_DN1218_c0_g2_i19:1922-2263(+)